MYFDAGTGAAPWVRYYFPGATGPFYGWKVDLVSPYRRTAPGFDVLDEVLDIVVQRDRTYRLKDAEELDLLVARGIYSPEDAASVRRAASDVVRLIESGAPPFHDEWTGWQPPKDLSPRKLPRGWQHIPLAPDT